MTRDEIRRVAREFVSESREEQRQRADLAKAEAFFARQKAKRVPPPPPPKSTYPDYLREHGEMLPRCAYCTAQLDIAHDTNCCTACSRAIEAGATVDDLRKRRPGERERKAAAERERVAFLNRNRRRHAP